MNYTCQFHPLTKQDFEDAYEWYEDKQKGLGERFLTAIRQKIEEIILYPELYGSRSTKKFREVQIAIFPYIYWCIK